MSIPRSLWAGAIAGLAVFLSALAAGAFCGFFVAGSDAKLTNNASQVALMRKGNRTVMTMSNNYQGPPENFAMVVPVPVVLHKEDVKTLPADVFEHIDPLSAPRLVEYWEQDPVRRRSRSTQRPCGAVDNVPADDRQRAAQGDHGVKVEARFATGEYEIVILSAQRLGRARDVAARDNYNIPQGAAGALAPYVRDQMKFFVAKVNIKKVQRDVHGRGRALAAALRASTPTSCGCRCASACSTPTGKQDLIVYVLHPTSRFEVANYPERLHPDQPRSRRRGAHRASQPSTPSYSTRRSNDGGQGGGHRIRLADDLVRSLPDAAAVARRSVDARARRDRGDRSGGLAAPPAGRLHETERHRARSPAPPQPFYGAPPSWVLTRLHTRYSKETLSEDLIFREAKPVIGGRANWNGTSGDAGASVTPGGDNNFQGRYIIRHYWDKAVACKDPQYDRWGGPPGDPSGNNQPTAAKGLATAPRGQISLAKEVRSPVPLLGIPGRAPPRRKGK